LRFRPNLEIGVGSDQTLVAANIELAYRIPVPQADEWAVLVGAGPALNVYHRHGDTDPEGGFNFLVGIQHEDGLFAEFKIGALDSPRVKFGIGYTFHP
jgi:hypothetical protein